jgi:NADPH2:quinone reductase
VPLPDDISDEIAAAALLQGITAHYLATSAAPVGKGETALVQAAAGGVGLLLVQLVKMRGGRVIGTTSSEEKAEIARAAGADEVIGYEGLSARVRELTGGRGAEVAYDGIGRATFDESLASLAPRGTLVLFGMASGPPDPFDVFRLFVDALALRMTTMFRYIETRDELLGRANDVFGWIREGKLDVRVTSYPLEGAARAHAELEGRRTTGKLVLLPSA